MSSSKSLNSIYFLKFNWKKIICKKYETISNYEDLLLTLNKLKKNRLFLQTF